MQLLNITSFFFNERLPTFPPQKILNNLLVLSNGIQNLLLHDIEVRNLTFHQNFDSSNSIEKKIANNMTNELEEGLLRYNLPLLLQHLPSHPILNEQQGCQGFNLLKF